MSLLVSALRGLLGSSRPDFRSDQKGCRWEVSLTKTGDVGVDTAKDIVPIAEAGVLAVIRVEQGTETEVGVLIGGVPTGSTARLYLEGAFRDPLSPSYWQCGKAHLSGTPSSNMKTHGDGCRREETSHVVGRTSITDDVPTLGSIHHAVVVNVRPFGLFVELPGFRRNGLVHNSQISEDVVFSREDDDDVKMKAMEYFAPKGSQVMTPPHTGHPLAP